MPTYLPPRRGISQSEALAEASAYAGEPILLTLAFTHSAIVDPDTGEQIAVYAVNAFEPLEATLEADAPLDGGQVVTFQPVPMEVTLPTENDGGNAGEVAITISNAARLLGQYLAAVAQSDEPVTVIARTYLPSDTSAPHETPPLQVTLRSATSTVSAVTARAGFGDISNRTFPRLACSYTQQSHPGLSAS